MFATKGQIQNGGIDMLHMEWKNAYSIGHDEIDKQHQRLVNIINHLLRSLTDALEDREVDVVLTEVVEYTRYHFRTEEDLMAKHGYPDLQHHRELHKALVQQVAQKFDDLSHGKEVTAIDLISFLQHWLIEHIVAEDKRIGEFLNSLPKNAGIAAG